MHILAAQQRGDTCFILHLNSLKSNIFTSAANLEDNCLAQERCCKAVLSYFGKRAGSFEVPYVLLGCYCSNRSEYPDKIAALVERFEISAIFIGTLKINLPVTLNCNIFHINRIMGALPDQVYLKESIHREDSSNLVPCENRGKTDYKAKLETEFIVYRFRDFPKITEHEREMFKQQIIGSISPHEVPKLQMLAEEEKREGDFIGDPLLEKESLV